MTATISLESICPRLPPPARFAAGIRRAPKRPAPLTSAETALAVKKRPALRPAPMACRAGP
jgi:hypothetical protein